MVKSVIFLDSYKKILKSEEEKEIQKLADELKEKESKKKEDSTKDRKPSTPMIPIKNGTVVGYTKRTSLIRANTSNKFTLKTTSLKKSFDGKTSEKFNRYTYFLIFK